MTNISVDHSDNMHVYTDVLTNAVKFLLLYYALYSSCWFHVGSLHICSVLCYMSTAVLSYISVRLSHFNKSYLLT